MGEKLGSDMPFLQVLQRSEKANNQEPLSM